MKRIKIYLLPAIACLLVSCIKEDTSGCNPVVSLKYDYSLNVQEKNLFGPEINKITLYAFDQNDLFYEMFQEEGDQLQNDWVMKCPLPHGKYTIVAWGGAMSTFHVGEMVDEHSSQFFNGLRKGVTTLDDFRILIQHQLQEGSGHVIGTCPDDLYYGMVRNVVSTNSPSDPQTIHLIKNTNTIRLKIGGIKSLLSKSVLPLEMYVTARNGRYNYENEVTEAARMVKYCAPPIMQDPDTMVIDLRVLRLLEQDHSAKLTMKWGTLFTQDIDLVSAIIKSYGFDENTQYELDKHSEYLFNINIDKDLSISIYVNGWKIMNVIPEL